MEFVDKSRQSPALHVTGLLKNTQHMDCMTPGGRWDACRVHRLAGYHTLLTGLFQKTKQATKRSEVGIIPINGFTSAE